MVDASALARPPSSLEDAGASFDRVAYAATTLLHIRPFDPLQLELLHCLRGCPVPLSLHALATLSGWSPTTVVWLLGPLVQHGLVKRCSLPHSPAEEKGAAR
jgi:hypothetical protein